MMGVLRRQPLIYEINTWVWLAELSAHGNGPVDLGSVPAQTWDALAEIGFDAVWLMGVWQRSPAGIAIATENLGLMDEFRRVLPDFHAADNVGSAYCVRSYVVDAHLGGPKGLAVARKELARRGLALLLDFVPNHFAPDAPWIGEHPEFFMQASVQDLQQDPAAFIQIGEKIFAHGRDPYFPPWPDVVQVNAFAPGFSDAVVELILTIAEQCDGIRCDMAMLLMNDIFARTWGQRAGPAPGTEFWPHVLSGIRQKQPDFLFIAEAYWDMEWPLQQQGFDYCYDKRLYDRLEHGDAEGVCAHLGAELQYQERLIRFIENHDEPPAAVTFSRAQAETAAVTIATIPGAKLFHEGQLQGHKIRVPVFLGRRPPEPDDAECLHFYQRLLKAVSTTVFHQGQWAQCASSGWPDNHSWRMLGAWCWTYGPDRGPDLGPDLAFDQISERRLVLVNFTGGALQAKVRLPWNDLGRGMWRLTDALSAASYDRDGQVMESEGLFVELAAWTGQILAFHAIDGTAVD